MPAESFGFGLGYMSTAELPSALLAMQVPAITGGRARRHKWRPEVRGACMPWAWVSVRLIVVTSSCLYPRLLYDARRLKWML